MAPGLREEDDRDLQRGAGHVAAGKGVRMPASAPPRSRTKVTPASSVRRALAAASSAQAVSGVVTASARSRLERAR